MGVVIFEHRGVYQRGEVVVKARRVGMMRRKQS
jgi:acyl dehydratase